MVLAYLHDDGGVSPQEGKQTAVIRWSRSSFSSHPVCFVSTDKSGWLVATPAIKRRRRRQRTSNAQACARARTHTRTHALVLVHVWTQALAWRILIPGEVWSVKQGWRNAVFWSRKWNAPPSISATVAAAVAAARLWCAKWTSPPLCRLFLPWLSTHPSRETSKKKRKNTFSFLLAARPNGKNKWTNCYLKWEEIDQGAAADEIREGFYIDQLVIPESQLL